VLVWQEVPPHRVLVAVLLDPPRQLPNQVLRQAVVRFSASTSRPDIKGLRDPWPGMVHARSAHGRVGIDRVPERVDATTAEAAETVRVAAGFFLDFRSTT
jgi:hypothetical protein